MSTYEKIDLLADMYNPALFLVLSGYILLDFIRGEKTKAAVVLISLFAGMSGVYGMMWLDKSFNVYAYFSLDYSTHTAFAACVVIFLSSFYFSRKSVWILSGSFLFYLAVMNYQQYHTPGDMLVTLINVVPFLWVIVSVAVRRRDSGLIEKPDRSG